MLDNGRNGEKIRPLGFNTAALVLTSGLQPETQENLTRLVREIAGKYGYNDALALRKMRRKLDSIAAKPRTGGWAREVKKFILDKVEKQQTQAVTA